MSRAPRWAVIAAFSVVAALAAVLAYWFAARTYAGRGSEGFNEETAAKKAPPPARTLAFLRMDGCGWCDRFKPTWAEFKANHAAALAAAGVSLVEVEASEPAMAKYKAHVKGYPTVLLVEGHKMTKFEGDRTVPGLVDFLKGNGVALGGGAEHFATRAESGGAVLMRNAGKSVDANKPDERTKAKQANSAGFEPGPL
jgi:hypothetical protein